MYVHVHVRRQNSESIVIGTGTCYQYRMFGYCACESLLTGTCFYLAPPCKSMYAIIQTRSSLGPGPGIAPGNVPVLIDDVPVVLCKYEYHYMVYIWGTPRTLQIQVPVAGTWYI